MATRPPAPTTNATLLTALLIFTAYAAAQTPPLGLSTLYSFTDAPNGASHYASVVIGNGGALRHRQRKRAATGYSFLTDPAGRCRRHVD
jgi:hypothetical protein